MMRKLTALEIIQINKIESLNGRKDAIQNLVIQEWVKSGTNGIFTGFTSIGKSYTICKVLKILNKKPEQTACVIVPTIDLKNDLLKDIEKYELVNVDVWVVNSLANHVVKKDNETYYDLVIADEIHSLCGANSMYFSEIIPRIKRKHFFGVSATLERDHILYLKKYGLEVFFEIPLEDGYKTNVVPEYCIYNIPVYLNDDEQRAYIAAQTQYLQIVEQFMKINQFNPVEAIRVCLEMSRANQEELTKYEGEENYPPVFLQRFADKLGWKPGQLIGQANKWQGCMTKRKMILSDCQEGIQMAVDIANMIQEQAVIVCSKIEVAEQIAAMLPSGVAYHSKLKVKEKRTAIEGFNDMSIKNISVVNSLKMGYNNDKLRFLIRQGYTSKALDLTQFLGRLMRPDADNPDKFSILINIYVEDFKYGNRTYESQQKKWLKSALYRRNFCEWIQDIEEIVI